MDLDLDISHHSFSYTYKVSTPCAQQLTRHASLFLNSNKKVSNPLSTLRFSHNTDNVEFAPL